MIILLNDIVVFTDEEKQGLVDAIILLKSLTNTHKSSEQIINELQASLIKTQILEGLDK